MILYWIFEEHYEKHIKELEEENEIHVNELSRLEKSAASFRAEHNELRALANESNIYKEREDGLIQEIATLKNEIRLVYCRFGEI